MRIKLFFMSYLLFFIFACTEEITSPPIEIIDYPDKLSPYETFYDEATFKQRRNDLLENLPEGSFAVITTNDLYLPSGEENYDFRPDNSFYYLTGFDEPNSAAVIRPSSINTTGHELILFVETRESWEVQWLGPVYGTEGAVEFFHADSAYDIEDFGRLIKSYLINGSYQSVFENLDINQNISDLFYNCGAQVPASYNINDIVDHMRVIKSPIEISAIQKAVDVTVQGFTEFIKAIEPNMYEYEVEAIFDFIVRTNGCERTAFPSIVASGPNINILHYTANQRQMLNGDLVMIDAAAEYCYYAADITRTLPVSGTFTQEQRTVYQIVLDTHKAILDAAAPGVSYYDLYYLNRNMMIDGLLEHGIISGTREEIIADNSYRKYVDTGLGHPVNLYVHDPFPAEPSGDKLLKENMVMAIEPHIYLNEGDETVASSYWNCSARIEDIILITSDGCEILSDNLPMEISEIESLMNL